MIKRTSAFVTSTFLFLASPACSLLAPTDSSPEQGGANVNDRTFGGEPGQALLTGAMSVSPSGDYALMQRNTLSVVYDVKNKTYNALPFRVVRVAYSKQANVAIFSQTDGTLVAFDLVQSKVLWSTPSDTPSLIRVSDDGNSVIAASGLLVNVFDAQTGAARGGSILGSAAEYATEIPGQNAILVVGDTSWSNHKPSTPVIRVDLATASSARTDIPNCSAPIDALPDGSRALVSPTFCEEGTASNASADSWTNPDPVSIIDMDANGLHFLKNLPGFGPVALRTDGSLAVAYLDTKRMDPSMFDDASKVPSASSPEYHLMTINPKTLDFTLTPIGDALPRFAMTRDGKGLLVDASIKITTRVKANASATLSIGPNGVAGTVSASAGVFQDKSPFGYFDLTSLAFIPFTGTQAGLDRFVQLSDGVTVIALEKRSDGLGGTPHKIDLVSKTVTPLSEAAGSSGIRDIGLLADGKTLLVRMRMAAATKNNQLYSQEGAYLSFDFSTELAGSFSQYTDPNPFATVDPENSCPGGHDCW